MTERLLQLSLFFGVFLVVVTSADECVKSVFLFGDSQLDAGNNRFLKNCTNQANFPPYGSTYFHHPTGRFTNGRTVADFIAQYLGIEFQRPFQEVLEELTNHSRNDIPANGINFASGGSGVLPETNKNTWVTPIQEQLQQFQALIDKNHLEKKQIEDSMFFLESGSNDIFNYFVLSNSPKPTPGEYVDAMLKEVAIFVDKIANIGARRIGIFSVGPNGCVPARVLLKDAPINECFEKVNNMSELYNNGLEVMVKNISKMYPGSVGVYGAVYKTVYKIRADPKVHGFTNINDACCGYGTLNAMLQCGLQGYKMCSNPNEFFFWDLFHPSEHTYELLAEDLWAGNQDQIRPINLKNLACNITLS